MGKTSTTSRFNLPGKTAWILMESPGVITLLYIMYSLPKEQGISFSELPFENKTLATLFVCSYIPPFPSPLTLQTQTDSKREILDTSLSPPCNNWTTSYTNHVPNPYPNLPLSHPFPTLQRNLNRRIPSRSRPNHQTRMVDLQVQLLLLRPHGTRPLHLLCRFRRLHVPRRRTKRDPPCRPTQAQAKNSRIRC